MIGGEGAETQLDEDVCAPAGVHGPCPWNCGRGGHVVQNAAKRSRGMPVVLLISSDNETRLRVQSALQRERVRLVTAELEDESLIVASELEPNLVLLDLVGSGGQRFDVCKAFQLDPGCWRGPVILISPAECLPVKLKALECGAVDYLSKPIEIPELIGRVRLHIRLQHALESMADMHARHIQELAGAQQFCMPKPADIPEAQFHVEFCQVHQAGGDFYDVLRAGDHEFDYIVADATGHDLSASYWTMGLKTLLSEYTNLLFQPVDMLYLLNRALLRLLPPGVFFTSVYARMNRLMGRLELLSAGHPPTIVLTRAGEPRIIRQSGDVLGAFPDASFGRTEIAVGRGDRVFLMSDGFLDCWQKQGLGIEAVSGELQGPKSEVGSVVKAVFAECIEKFSLADDALLMGIEV